MVHFFVTNVVLILGMAIRAPAHYNESRAIQFAQLAGAAGCDRKSVEAWTCGKCNLPVTSVNVCQGKSTHAFVALWESTCVMGFQGTHDVFSVFQDLMVLKNATPWDACHGCRVHKGWLDEYMSMKPCLMESLHSHGCNKTSGIRSTGWSLGAATSTLAMLDLTLSGWKIEESYDFGKPRVGDASFAALHDALLGNVTWRITHGMDPVVHVPPEELLVDWNFKHVEPEAFYPGNVRDGHKECSVPDSITCSGQYSNLVNDVLHVMDHFHYMDVRMGKAGCTTFPEQASILV